LGELTEAESHYREALKDSERARTRHQFAGLLISMNRFAEAKDLLDEGLRITERGTPKSALDRALNDHDVAEIHLRYGELYNHCGAFDLAKNHLITTITEQSAVSGTPASSPYFLSSLGWAYHHLSQLHIHLDQLDDAEEAARKSLEIWSSRDGPAATDYSAIGHYRLGELAHWKGRTNEARSHFQLAKQELETISRDLPNEPFCQRWLILLLADCPDESLRDPKRAVTLAQRVIRDTNAPLWRYLALSQYRSGDSLAARRCLEKSLKLRRGGDALDWLLLAMVHWRMGKQPEALDWYGRAQKAVASRQPISYGDIGVQGFQRLANEAATTLSVTVAPSDNEPAALESGL
jgi:tetratricopeptide (TPR) repeat protein